jgi:hypothetical protein
LLVRVPNVRNWGWGRGRRGEERFLVRRGGLGMTAWAERLRQSGARGTAAKAVFARADAKKKSVGGGQVRFK